jgi:D-alanine-D-alanine ligase
MHIVLLFNQLSAVPAPDEQDILSQCDAVEYALREAGHRVSRIPCSIDLADVKSRLLADRPDIVFNLVESVDGTDRLMPLATLLLESLQIPFTGASSHAIITSSGKVFAKQKMLAAGLPTPAWLTGQSESWQGNRPQRAIIKAVWEHASVGMDDSAVIDVSVHDAIDAPAFGDHSAAASGRAVYREDLRLADQLRERDRRTGRTHFAEQFIEGREFNITLLANPKNEHGAGDPEVMPPAEILFIDFPAGQPQIVGYNAKWSEDSTEYRNTPRTFEFSAADGPLLEMLKAYALRCWSVFGMRGWARVDFRVDQDGQPWILEMNANPCLSPDAGFAAAIRRANISWPDAVRRILVDAIHAG